MGSGPVVPLWGAGRAVHRSERQQLVVWDNYSKAWTHQGACGWLYSVHTVCECMWGRKCGVCKYMSHAWVCTCVLVHSYTRTHWAVLVLTGWSVVCYVYTQYLSPVAQCPPHAQINTSCYNRLQCYSKCSPDGQRGRGSCCHPHCSQ